MAGKDIIKMSHEEAKRLCVIQKALSREINQVKLVLVKTGKRLPLINNQT